MASWQYDLHVIPRRWLIDRFGTVPRQIDICRIREEEWWGAQGPEFDLERRFAAVLSPSASWSTSLRFWGEEDGDRIDIYLEKSRVIAVNVRIDLRQPSREFVLAVVGVAAEAGCVFCNTAGTIIEPRLDDVLDDIVKSDAVRFVTDPKGFLAGLDR